LAVLRRALEPASFRQVSSVTADVVISCGASAAPVNLLFSSLNRARSIVVMNPTPLPLSRFSLALVPEHDRVHPRPNVVRTAGALSWIHPGSLEAARRHLTEHPRFRARGAWPARVVIGVFIGGDTPEVALDAAFARRLAEEMLAACEAHDAACLVTTSRRTPEAVVRVLDDRMGAHPRCPLLLVAGRDSLNGTLDGMLGWAELAVVTSDSVSMVSEAWASGRRVVVVEAPARAGARGRRAKTARFLQSLSRQGGVRLSAVAALREAIGRSLREPAARAADDLASSLRSAVSKLL
jgi:mitochondrial fission protein ELM1